MENYEKASYAMSAQLARGLPAHVERTAAIFAAFEFAELAHNHLASGGEENITTAAVRSPAGLVHTLPRPARHGDVLHAIYDQRGLKSEPGWAQGFLTSRGRFVEREEARAIAIAAEQCKEPELHQPHAIFSEELW